MTTVPVANNASENPTARASPSCRCIPRDASAMPGRTANSTYGQARGFLQRSSARNAKTPIPSQPGVPRASTEAMRLVWRRLMPMPVSSRFHARDRPDNGVVPGVRAHNRDVALMTPNVGHERQATGSEAGC